MTRQYLRDPCHSNEFTASSILMKVCDFLQIPTPTSLEPVAPFMDGVAGAQEHATSVGSDFRNSQSPGSVGSPGTISHDIQPSHPSPVSSQHLSGKGSVGGQAQDATENTEKKMRKI